MSVNGFAIVLYAMLAFGGFMAGCLLVDPAGPTTIGRGGVPFLAAGGAAAWFFVSAKIAECADALASRL